MESVVDFWKGKKVLVTGHTGFKGCWLSIWLHKLGANVRGFSLKEYPNEIMFKDCGMGYRMKDIRGDINNLEELGKVFDSVDIVFHLAAQSLVRKSYYNPLETLKTNIIGTANVLECIRNSDTKAGVIVTSDKCYENKNTNYSYNETDPLGGIDPYSCSKGCAELVVKSWNDSFLKDKKIATARAGNVIGGGDWAEDRLIPDCVKALEKNKAIEIRNPSFTRPWQHVLEPLSGYLLLGQKLLEGENFEGAWNFGPNMDSNLKVQAVVKMFIDKWGSGDWKDISEETDNLHESKLLSLDISKANSMLGWKPKLNIEDAVYLTSGWYKNYKNKDPYELTIAQIEEYEKK